MAFEIPLFPLNTVLFPGMPLQLHIFEERYKKMLRLCLENRQDFGVVLIRSGREAHGPLADPHKIGCTARIVEMEPLDQGQMNITAIGQQRFRLLSLSREKPYLVGTVELYPLEAADRKPLSESSRRLFPLVRRYMQILSAASEVNLEPEHLPRDPLVLAYLSAVLLQIPPGQKQGLLASERASDLLRDVYELYRRELALLPTLLSTSAQELPGQFSRN
jgi:Lon protease-like protein